MAYDRFHFLEMTSTEIEAFLGIQGFDDSSGFMPNCCQSRIIVIEGVYPSPTESQSPR